jgi:hypothetical protein
MSLHCLEQYLFVPAKVNVNHTARHSGSMRRDLCYGQNAQRATASLDELAAHVLC